ncbi:MAG TPA: antitoxin VapB family protein [Nitrososphaeraceae archaeon]
MYKRITVGLRQDVYTKLRNKGKFGESFSELIGRLLNEIDKIDGDERWS